MAHRSARLTVFGRQLLVDRVETDGWTIARAAEAAAQLPQALGDALLTVARDSFVSSMQTVAIVSAVLAVGAAVWAYLAIRRPSSDDKAAGESWSRSTKVASEA